jgi:halimadienyl-diphosphate synthase
MWIDTRAAVASLLAGLVADPNGQVGASEYETGRLVALAPWLAGHDRRVAYLVRAQHHNGGWGRPDGYGLIPTLSATDALLAAGATGPARRGLDRLWQMLAGAQQDLPDLPASDIVVPALVDSIGPRIPDGAPLPLPARMDRGRLELVRGLIRAGAPVDLKLAHAFEVCGPLARGSRAVGLSTVGSIGASPAATAAWLGSDPPAAGHPARNFLEAVARRLGGQAPCTLPIATFERAWVLATLCRAGLLVHPPSGPAADLVTDLTVGLDRGALATAPGLPPDADTTSVALYAVARLGRPCRLDVLSPFAGEVHFSTWPGEQGESSSVNAHVLEAVGASVAAGGSAWPPSGGMVAALVTWLIEQQRIDGSWFDRWHASPYYATLSAATALHQYARTAGAAAVQRAVEWVLRTQNEDGSWGRWSGTAEETAYALQTVALTSTDGVDRTLTLRRGLAYLVDTAPGLASGDGRSSEDDLPPLWHDKDLYTPLAIVRASVLAAIDLVQNRLITPGLQRRRQCA